MLLRACARAGEWRRAAALVAALQEEEGVRPDVETFNVLIASCEDAGRWQQAETLLGARLQRGAAQRRPTRARFVYSVRGER